MTISDLIVNFGDVIQLRDQGFDIPKMQRVLDASAEWKQYNPRKPINRFGLSITSADGGYSGVPDLDSLREYNTLNDTAFNERSFRTRTSICDELELHPFLDLWKLWLGRSHFLRMDAGGFFPPHRDNGLTFPPNTIRILVPIRWQKNHAVWIQDGKILHLEEGQAYFINTMKEHSIFSYQDNSILMVLNVAVSSETILQVAQNAKVL
jgi:hypothetical protein